MSLEAETDCDEPARSLFLAESCASAGLVPVGLLCNVNVLDVGYVASGNSSGRCKESEQPFGLIGSKCRGVKSETR